MYKELGLENKSLLYSLSAILLICIGIAIYSESKIPLILPIALLAGMVLFLDWRTIYTLLIFSIPISLHFHFGSLALDVFSEPLMVMILAISPFILINRFKKFAFLLHPIIIILVLQYMWSLFTALYSVDTVVSYKYLLSKLWFIIPFVVIGGYIINKPSKFKTIFWPFFISILIVAINTAINHANKGFSFAASSTVIQPFFHNHVNYSACIAIFIPFCWFARYWYDKGSFKRNFITYGFIFLIFSIIISYTRASWLAVFLLIPTYFAIRLKLTKIGLVLGVIGISGCLYFLINQNKYLDYSIDYEKVIFNKGDIQGHLKATYQMEDVSGMERIYRWVAAKNMIAANFFTGTGPNTFYPEYKKYTVNSFETYVSENPEQSTSHNYFILVFSEQGVVGFAIMFILYAYLLIKGTELSSKFTDQNCNNLAMATTLALVMLLLHLFLNDLIETDKIGSLFFICCVVLVRLDLWPKDIEFQSTKQDI